MGEALTAVAILHAATPRQPVEVKEWGGTVYVRSLTYSTIQELYADQDGDTPDWRPFVPVILLNGLVDADGKPLFTDEGEVGQLMDSGSFAAVMTCVNAIMEASALSSAAEDELEKN